MTIHVTLVEPAGWEVVARVGDQPIFRAHCGDWHRVERLVSRMRRAVAPGADDLRRVTAGQQPAPLCCR